MPCLDPQDFREAFPQFDHARFADARVIFWLTLAGKQLAAERWRELRFEACCLFAAHYLTLEAEAAKDEDGSGAFTVAAGPVVSDAESKSVGGVSISRSKGRAGAAGAEAPAAGQWSLTIYGRQLWQLMQIIGAGGTVV
jgi:hypothetical protein